MSDTVSSGRAFFCQSGFKKFNISKSAIRFAKGTCFKEEFNILKNLHQEDLLGIPTCEASNDVGNVMQNQ